MAMKAVRKEIMSQRLDVSTSPVRLKRKLSCGHEQVIVRPGGKSRFATYTRCAICESGAKPGKAAKSH